MYAAASHGYHDGAMRAQVFLLAIPSVAMTVVGFALFGPGAAQPFDGARLRGGPTLGQSHLSLRAAVLQRFRGIDSTRNLGDIVIRAREGDQPEAIARCQTNGDGVCDVTLDFAEPIGGPLHAVVATGQGTILADGALLGNAESWGSAPGHPARLTGQTRGDFAIDVDARRGVFAAPFRDELVVTVRDGNQRVRGAKVTFRTDAADVPEVPASDNPEVTLTLEASDRGEAIFRVTPRMHTVEVDIEATALGRSAAWHGLLPVIPGAIWLDPESVANGALRLLTPVPRDAAYVTLATPTARLWSAVVPLMTNDTRGFSTGAVPWPKLARVPDAVEPPPMWLTISSDPLQTSAGTVGWPVGRIGWLIKNTPPREERHFRDQLLLDGMPAAEQRDQRRRNGARALASIALGAAAILEGVLLAHSSQARGFRAWAWTVTAIATVVLAFAAIGVVVMWKTSG
jgi:hypothetical protein